ncbi:MAG TPA: hypothetical protein VML58_16670, partial [Burkholderiaceae bacterium]|nr:hypothetical protein [Burkholderiaceae bacterium]
VTAYNKRDLVKFLQENHWAKFGGAMDLSVPMPHPHNAAIHLAVCDGQRNTLSPARRKDPIQSGRSPHT